MSIRPPRTAPTIPTSDLTEIFERSIEQARCRLHIYVTTEHLLMALLRCESARDRLRFWSVDALAVESALRLHLDRLPVVSSRQTAPRPSAAFIRVVAQVAGDPCRMSSTGSMLMNALLHEDDSRAVAILRSHGLDVLAPVHEFSEYSDPTEAGVDTVVEKLASLANALSQERRTAVGKTISAFVQTPGSDNLKHTLFSLLTREPTANAQGARSRRVAA